MKYPRWWLDLYITDIAAAISAMTLNAEKSGIA